MKKAAFLPYLIAFTFILSGSDGQTQGWVITESDNSLTYISDGWVKSINSGEEEGDNTILFNADKDIIVMIDDANERYAKGSGEDYCSVMKALKEEMNKQMPADQKKMMEDMINEAKAKPAPKVTFTKGAGEKIAGYQTEKYSIYSDGELFEEKWITTDPALKSVIDVFKKSLDLSSRIMICGVADESFLKNSPEFSPEYKNVERIGIELKNVRSEFGDQGIETEVISIEKEDIPSSEFDTPEGYSEVSFKDLMMDMMSH